MNSRQKARPEGIAEFLFNELKYALRDIRQKVAEEGWFGRIVTPAKPGDMQAAATERPEPSRLYADDHNPLQPARTVAPEYRPSFDEQWAVRDRAETSPADIGKEHGIDLDR